MVPKETRKRIPYERRTNAEPRAMFDEPDVVRNSQKQKDKLGRTRLESGGPNIT